MSNYNSWVKSVEYKKSFELEDFLQQYANRISVTKHIKVLNRKIFVNSHRETKHKGSKRDQTQSGERPNKMIEKEKIKKTRVKPDKTAKKETSP